MSARVHRVDEAGGHWIRLVLEEAPGNLLSLAMVRALDAALDGIAGARHLRWLTLEGAGGQFCYGARIQEHRPEPMREVLPATHALLRRWLSLPVPTAALVEGRCLGGGFELALCTDDILASANATFGLPEVRLAAFPPMAALVLPLRVGASRASRAIVTGSPQSAEYWHQAGLVSVVPPDHALLDAARAWFDGQLAGHSAVALGHAVQAARTAIAAQVDASLPALERRYLEHLLATDDAVEGIEAWGEKRTPRWQDR